MFDWIGDKIGDFFIWLSLLVIDNSYYLCLFVCMGALILYIAGIKKSGKYATASLIVYYFLQCIGSALK